MEFPGVPMIQTLMCIPAASAKHVFSVVFVKLTFNGDQETPLHFPLGWLPVEENGTTWKEQQETGTATTVQCFLRLTVLGSQGNLEKGGSV